MNKEMQRLVKENKQSANILVRYANPKSKVHPSLETITAILVRNIPYAGIIKPVIKNITVTSYSKNPIIKSARFNVETIEGKIFEITAYQHLKGRTPEEREADKTATFPSGLFNIFHSEVLQ